jgi:PAS domain-containing protein
MRKADATPLAVRLECITFGPKDDRSCRTALIDITEQRQAEKVLRELSKTLQRRVQEQTAQIRLQAEAIARLGEGVLITAGPDWLESHIVFLNEAVCRTTGYTAGELIGQPRRICRAAEQPPRP